MKILFMIILLIANLLAFSDNLVVTNTKTTKQHTFEELISKAKMLKRKTEDERRDFEPLSVYEKRIQKAVEVFNKFLNNEYKIGFKPDSVRLDWENSTIHIYKNSDIPIIRNRGMANSVYNLHLVISVPPILARQLKVFPNVIIIISTYKINRKLQLVIEHLKVKYREDIIYEE